MRIYICDKLAFVEISKSYLLCIGTKAEIDKADDKKVMDMAEKALAVAQFNSLNPRKQAVN